MDVQGVPSQSNLSTPPNDEITNFDQLCENVTGKLNLENWMVLPSQRTLHIFCLNKKLNGNLSIRNTIFIDVNLVVRVFGEGDEDKLFSLKLYSWPQLQMLIEQCGVQVKREVNLEFVSVMEKATNCEVVADQKEDTLAFKFGGRITKTEVSDIHQPLVELIESTIPLHEASLAYHPENGNAGNQTEKHLLGKSNESVRLSQICSICNAIYLIDEIDQHMRQHFNGESYPCNVCGREYQSLIVLQKHVKSNHTVRGKFLCDICDGGRDFQTKESLKKHIKEIHCSAPMEEHGMKRSGKNKWKTCPFCHKSYISLNRHIQDRHFNVRNHVCDICGSAYKQWTSLKEHIEAKHAPHEELFCDICENGKAFPSKTSIRRHFAKIHGNVKAGQRRQSNGKSFYECNVCYEKLPSTYTLKSHVALRHNDGKHPIYHCGTCDKTFALKSLLDTHEKLHSGKLHSCSVCGQSFRHANYLRKHLKQHKDIQKLRCTMCEKEYVQRKGLRLHMEKMHGIVLGSTPR